MNTVGIFAGRGDVILAMGMALILGTWFGWKLKATCVSFSDWKNKRKQKDTPVE